MTTMLIKKLYDTVKGINQTDKTKCMNVLNDSDADKEVDANKEVVWYCKRDQPNRQRNRKPILPSDFIFISVNSRLIINLNS